MPVTDQTHCCPDREASVASALLTSCRERVAHTKASLQVAEAQEAAAEVRELVQEQAAVAKEAQRQAEEARREAGPVLRQAQESEQQVTEISSTLREPLIDFARTQLQIDCPVGDPVDIPCIAGMCI